MKLSFTALFIILPHRCHGFLASPSAMTNNHRDYQMVSSSSSHLFLTSQATSSDSAFSSFADSLEEEDEPTPKRRQGNQKQQQQQQKPWQAKLEDLLDPKTNLADRQILLAELLNSNEQIRDSVLDALANRRIDPLLTPTAAKLQDGHRAVIRQIANDILPQLQKAPQVMFPPSPASLEKVGSRLLNLVTNQIQKNVEDLQQDLSDPINRIPKRLEKQREEFVQEAKNVFLEKPAGLKEPPYTVVESCDLYEIRDYAGYTVASTSMMTDTTGDEPTMGGLSYAEGTAFNNLAAYLFGANKDSKSMAMTTPVTTTNLGEMRFYLAENKKDIPEPLLANSDARVEILEVPPARLAVRKFTGFATDGEVARQKDTLLQALEMDGVELDVAHGAVVPHVVFQYNPPYTIPIVRRNEIAVPVVRENPDESGVPNLKEEWIVDASDDGSGSSNDNIAPSD